MCLSIFAIDDLAGVDTYESLELYGLWRVNTEPCRCEAAGKGLGLLGTCRASATRVGMSGMCRACGMSIAGANC